MRAQPDVLFSPDAVQFAHGCVVVQIAQGSADVENDSGPAIRKINCRSGGSWEIGEWVGSRDVVWDVWLCGLLKVDFEWRIEDDFSARPLDYVRAPP